MPDTTTTEETVATRAVAALLNDADERYRDWSGFLAGAGITTSAELGAWLSDFEDQGAVVAFVVTLPGMADVVFSQGELQLLVQRWVNDRA